VRDHAQSATPAAKPTFARHARAALEKFLPEARTASAVWSVGHNEAWVRFPREDGLWGYVALRRHLDWVTGEAGIAREPVPLADLAVLPGNRPADAPGFRIRLGHLLHGEDRWWPAGDSEGALVERLGFLALQLAVKGRAYFRAWPAVER